MIFIHLFQTASNPPIDVSALESSISALESAISALEAAIRALDNRSLPWEHALPWFTGMVIIGVALEWWVIRHDFREEMETWALEYFGVIRSAPRPSVGKLAVEIMSVALIVFGIFGELGTGLGIASINSSLRAKNAQLRSKNAELRSKSDQLLALVTQEAGDAAASAKTAKADARSVRQETALLKSDNAKLANRIEEETAQLNLITPRSVLLSGAEEEIAKAVLPFSGQRLAALICRPSEKGNSIDEGDLENADTRSALVEALALKGGWVMRNHLPNRWQSCRPDRWVGIFVFVNSDATPKTMEAARTLSRTLASVLPPQQRDILRECDLKTCSSEEFDFPGGLAAREPELIAVLIGTMPFPKALKKQEKSTPITKP